MKIYHLFFDEEEFSDETRTTTIRKKATFVGTHRTFEGAIKEATDWGYDMSNLRKEVVKRHEIISWSGVIKENGLIDEWIEIVETDLLD